ncbi:MAG: EF-P 5-aminopentanol modification-associated protein YfmF [Acutalibacteraceae bacterium]
MERKTIGRGLTLCTHRTEQFKTSVITLSLMAPLDSSVSKRALLIHLLARTNKDLPTMAEMNRKLAGLYGARLTPRIEKNGEAQVLSLSLIAVDNRFALEGEDVFTQGLELLLACLFRPDITEKGFKEENMSREKRQLCDLIDRQNDNKITYARKRLLEEMCCDEAYSISPLGEKEEIMSLRSEEIFAEWKKLLMTCPIQISLTGNFDEKKAEEIIRPYFDRLERKKEDIVEIRTEFLTESNGNKTVTETQKVNQGKLVIGYRAGMTYDRDNYAAIKLMTEIFGSGTFSKLFVNVREKMSLCYYCSASLIYSKGVIIVQSGVETENAQKALEAIRREMEDMRAGNFSDEVIRQAKLSLADSYRSVYDSVMSIDGWFLDQCVSGEFYTPQESSDMINAVSREEIIVAANMVCEDTVFILESEKEEK